jgi:hypothetical protein
MCHGGDDAPEIGVVDDVVGDVPDDDDKDRRNMMTAIAYRGRRNSRRGLRHPDVETAAACRGRQGFVGVDCRCCCHNRGA